MLRRSTLVMLAALVAGATTPGYASTITYDFSVRIGLAVANLQDFTLGSVQPGDVLHGTITLDTALPDTNGSPDVGQYNATMGPSTMSLTVGPYNPFPQETYSTSSFDFRTAENGRGFFGNEEVFILSDPFMANGNVVETLEIRLDSDSLAFLTGTGFPSAVDLGLLNGHSTFEFIGHDAMRPFDGFEFFGTITDFHVATDADVVPEPGSLVLLVSGLLAFAGRQRLSAKRVGAAGS
jgi:hypothetical protein